MDEIQPDLLQGDRDVHFAGVCSLDGRSQAPMDGFMASSEMNTPVPQARSWVSGVINEKRAIRPEIAVDKEGKEKMTLVMEPIGVIRSCFKEKFGIPRQAGLVQTALARIELFAPFGRHESLKDLEMFSHIWVQFYFHDASDEGWKSTVRPPGLGGRRRVGVFASRSPHRPNHIGLSAVRLLDIELRGDGASLVVGGGDFLDGSPVLDIKPYLVYSDCIGDAGPGYATAEKDRVEVVFSKQADNFCVAYRRAKNLDLRELIVETLRQDPRPASQKNREKTFGIRLWEVNIRWLAQPGVFTVLECRDLKDEGWVQPGRPEKA